jgi:hypothetical protein
VIYIALGFLLVGLLVGGAGLRAAGRFARRSWRPGAGILALAAFVGAAIMGVRESFPAALVLGLVGVWLTLSVRRVRPSAPWGERGSPTVRGMGVEAAADILGVSPDATDEEVQSAYLRLIRRVHPDAGGASGLAAQLNAARDVMARRRR